MTSKSPYIGTGGKRIPFALSAVAYAVLVAVSSTAVEAAVNEKLVGGEDAQQIVFQGDTTASPFVVDVNEVYDEIIGGHHVKQIKNEGASADNLVAVSSDASSVTISNVDGVQFVVGGSKSNNSFAALTSTDSSVKINGGTIGTGAEGGDSAVIGGNLIKATVNQGGSTATSETTSSTVTVTGGTFNMQVGTPGLVGGSMADDYSGQSEGVSLKVHDQNARLIVTGGDFSAGGDFIGGAVASGAGAAASVDHSEVRLTGGIFNGDTRRAVYGGSIALEGATATNKTSTVFVDGNAEGSAGFTTNSPSDSKESGQLEDTLYVSLYGGGLNAATTELSSLTIQNATLGFRYTKNDDKASTKTVGVQSGSRYVVAGSYEEGNAQLTVSNSTIMGDLRGGSWMGALSDSEVVEYHVTAGDSIVTVNNAVMNGYTKGVSTWNGRIFGAGIVQYTEKSTYKVNSTTVRASNILGQDTEEGSGEVTHNPGARIFGGGQLYNNGLAQKNTLTVLSTDVELTGAESEVMDVIGGSIVSGTNKYDTNKVVLGSSKVHVADAYVANRIVGGNDVNWFGTGEVKGNTSILVDGATQVGEIVGANTATFVANYVFGDGVRRAEMTGNTTVTVGGTSEVERVIGAGYAFSAGEGNPKVDAGDGTTSDRTEDSYNEAAVSTLTGNTILVVQDQAHVSQLIGAGFAYTDSTLHIDGGQDFTHVGNGTMEGTTQVTVSGGQVGQLMLGGLGKGFGKASLTGDAQGQLSAGTVDTLVIGGVGANSTVYDYNYTTSDKKVSLTEAGTSYGTAKVSGNATFTATGGSLGKVFLGGALLGTDGSLATPDEEHADQVKVGGTATLILAGDVDLSKAQVQAASAENNKLQFGTEDQTWSGSFANFAGIDELAVMEGSDLNLQNITVDQMGETGMTLTGTGLVAVETLNHAEKTLTLADGTLKVDTIAMTDSGALTVDGGTLQTTTDQIFTQGLGAEGTVLDAGEKKENGVTFTSGTVSFSDAVYNTHYASSAAALVGTGMDVAFTGTLLSVDETDGAENVVTVDDYNSPAAGQEIAENVTFANAALDATGEEGTNLTIGVQEDADDIVIDQSVGVKQLSLKDETQLVTVNDGKVLTLIGGGEDVLSGGADGVKIQVGSEDKGSGTLRLGLSGVATSGGQVNADVSVLEGSTVLVADGADFAFEKTLENNGLVVVEGRVEASLSGAGTVEVGSETAAGEVVLKGDTMGSNVIFLDPVWKESGGDVITNASKLFWDTDKVDGTIIAGQNSWFALGTEDSTQFESLFAASGFTWGPDGITAAAYVEKPISLDSKGALIVDGSLTEKPDTVFDGGTVRFGANSLLIANVSSLESGKALISGANDASTVDQSSKIVLSGVKTGGIYKIVDQANAQWKAENVSSANAMFGNATVNTTTGEISFELQNADTVYGDLMQGTPLADAAMRDASTGAYAYADELLTQTDGNRAAAAARFDAAMNPGGALAVFTTAYDRSSELRDAVRSDNKVGMNEKGLWVELTGNRTKLKGISTGAQDLHVETKAYGVVVGGEHDFGGKTFGLAFMAGTGDTENDSVGAEDDFDYYGLSFYTRAEAAGFEILGDVSATWLKSDLTVGGVADVDTDTTTTVWSAGVQVQKPFDFGFATLTPFVGADLYHVRSDGYHNGHGAKIDDESATVVEFPIGAQIAKSFQSSDVVFEPHFSLAVVPTVGDRDFSQTVTFAGASSDYNFTFADDVKVRSRLGIDMKTDAFRFGLSAGYDWGNEERDSVNVQVRATYAF